MATARTELIHCDNCGEDYAATYRRCPFCDAKPGQRFDYDDEPDYEEPYDDPDDLTAPRPGGKRLAGGAPRRRPSGRGPRFWLRVALYALTSIVILAAIWILCTYIFPKFFPARDAQTEPSPSASATVAPSPSPSAAPASDDPNGGLEPLPVIDDDPLGLDNPDLPPVEQDPISSQTPVTAPSPTPTPPVSVTAAPTASIKLSSLDFTLSPKYPTYQMEIDGVGRAQATYEMANTNVATVSANGLITAVANGNTKLTVTDKNGNSATAIVRVSGMDAAASQAPASAAPSPAASNAPSSGQAKLSTTDFTINATYPDPVRLKVSGGTVTGWSSSDGSVATVSENGTVTGVGNGTAKITCTLQSGEKLTCTVRVADK